MTKPLAREAKPSPGYWQLVGRDFFSNRLATIGAVVIAVVIAVGVFCPLIANHKPLYIHAPMPFEYINSYGVVAEQAPLDTMESRRLIGTHLDLMAQHLSESDRKLLDEVRQNPTSPAFAELANASLQPVTRWPAIRGLQPAEIFTMALFILAIVVYTVRRHLKRTSLRLACVLLPSLALAILWRLLIPPVHDALIYRTLIASPEFAAAGGTAIRAPISYGENENIIFDERQPPTWLIPPADRGANWHWLGTDTNGRDVLTRMVYGARVSMLIGIFAVSIYTAIGVVLGALAGFYRGWADIFISRFIEIVICFPALMLILSVQAFLQPSLKNIIIALALLWWTSVARLQRGEFLRLVDLDFVQSVRALGGTNMRIIFLHILPNALGPILVLVSFGIAGSILVESALSFLGFGVPQPMASWGDLLNNGRNDIKGTWWLTVFPGFAIFLTVTCFNLMGEGIRDALDPRRQH